MDLIFASPLQKQAATQNEAATLVGSVSDESSLFQSCFRSGAGSSVLGFAVRLSGLAVGSEEYAAGLVAGKTVAKLDGSLISFRSEVLQKVVDESEKVLHNLVSVLHENADAAK